MITFTAEQLRRFAPVAKPEIIGALVDGIDKINAAGIDTPLVLHHFLAQIAVETGGLKTLEENLNYTAERLPAVWPSRFPTIASAKPYAKNPKKLANKVYGGRLGNIRPNDGWDYRGSSLIQTTGRFNFRKAGYEDHPEQLREDAREALKAALTFWVDNGCSVYAKRNDIVGLRKKINGPAAHGLDEARNYLKKARTIFDGEQVDKIIPLSMDEIKALQSRLIELGYVSVGNPDGYIGTMTIGAISSFQAEHGLTVNGQFDSDTRRNLKTATPRPIPATRVDSEPSDSRILKSSRLLKKGAMGVMGAAGLSEVTGPLTALEMVNGYYQRIKALMEPLRPIKDFVIEHPIIIVAVIAGGVYLISKAIEKERIDDHQTGRTA